MTPSTSAVSIHSAHPRVC